MQEALLLLLLLQIKHFAADFVLQWDYTLKNRRIYGHPGGLAHVAIHGLGTLVAFLVWGGAFAQLFLIVLIAEVVLHYHIDWAKDNLNAKLDLGMNDQKYWWLVGFDQFLHQATYVVMVAYLAPF